MAGDVIVCWNCHAVVAGGQSECPVCKAGIVSFGGDGADERWRQEQQDLKRQLGVSDSDQGIRDVDDPVEGIRWWHLWLLGILAWPLMFLFGIAMTWGLFPFDAVCPPSLGASDEFECLFGWGAVLAAIAAVGASLAVALAVRSVHTRQAKARQIRDSEVQTRP